jgi:glycerol-3-phosphate cytidylyltransferase-like family protein
MQREAQQKINLVSEKKELEFLIEDQKEAQDTLRNEFERLTRDKKVEIERLNQINNELEMETEKQSKRREILNQEVAESNESYNFGWNTKYFYIYIWFF